MTEASAGETIEGEVPVTLRLPIGTERLSLFFTPRRIIVAKVGSRVAGSAAAFPALSGLSGVFESLFKRGKEAGRNRKARQLSLSPDLILRQDRDNFQVGYDEIVSVELIESPRRTGITLVTRDDKMFFFTSAPLWTVNGLLKEKLGERLTLVRMPEVRVQQPEK